MATEPKQPKPEQDAPERKTQQEGSPENAPGKSSDAKEGMPGYGQPEEPVREKFLPDQKW